MEKVNASRQYEELIKVLLETQISNSSGMVTIFGSKQYIGKSGHMHQIDVSAEFRFAGVKVLVLVECKCYSKRVGIDDVMEFAGRLGDIAAHKGIIVSTVGFQEGAAKFAKSKGIALVLACDLGWSPRLESPVSADQRHQEFLERARTFLEWSLSDPPDRECVSRAVERLSVADVTSGLDLTTQRFCSLREDGWGMRYPNVPAPRHAFVVMGDYGDLVLDSRGLFELMAIERAYI